MKPKLMIATLACGFSGAAFASSGNSFLDGYYVPSAQVKVENAGPDNVDESGDGFGLKGAFELAPDVFFTGEYENNKYDDDGSNIELRTFRLGLGLGAGTGTGGGLYGRVEYISADDPNDNVNADTGGVGTIGYALPLTPDFRIYGEAAYQKFDNLDGPEFLVGVSLQLAPNLGFFADYRNTQLDVKDSNVQLRYDEARIGARFYF